MGFIGLGVGMGVGLGFGLGVGMGVGMFIAIAVPVSISGFITIEPADADVKLLKNSILLSFVVIKQYFLMLHGDADYPEPDYICNPNQLYPEPA